MTRMTQVEYNRRFLSKQREKLLDQKTKQCCSKCGYAAEPRALVIARDNKHVPWSLLVRQKVNIQDQVYVLLCPTCLFCAEAGYIDTRPPPGKMGFYEATKARLASQAEASTSASLKTEETERKEALVRATETDEEATVSVEDAIEMTRQLKLALSKNTRPMSNLD